jgi:hypothetical protein
VTTEIEQADWLAYQKKKHHIDRLVYICVCVCVCIVSRLGGIVVSVQDPRVTGSNPAEPMDF